MAFFFTLLYGSHIVRNMDSEKNEIADHCWKFSHEMNWEEKKVIDNEPYLWARKIKETIHSIKDENHINSISYTLPDIWLPSIRKDQRAQNMKNIQLNN